MLVVGGRDLTAYPATAELWDPATGAFTATTGAPISPRATHTASLLASGKVLLAGGYRASALATAELYDPTTGTFTATGSLNIARDYQTATTLANGKVLVVGGAVTSLAELYDPTAGTFVTTGSLLIARASWHVAALLPSGKILIDGGLGSRHARRAALGGRAVRPRHETLHQHRQHDYRADSPHSLGPAEQ